MNSISLFDIYSLRLLQADDAQAIFNAIDSQRKYLGRWLPFVATTQHISHTQGVVTAMLTQTANPVFTIRAEGTFAGLIGFKSANPETHTIEIGYWMREEHQGRGVMTSAVHALCQRAFKQMGMEHVEIRCALDNAPSNGIPRRLGFRHDRVEPRGELLEDGTWADLNVYVLDRNA